LYQRRFAHSAIFAIAIGMTFPAQSAEAPVRRIASLGPQTVGSKLSEVRNYKRGDNCWIEKDNADCELTDPKSGVRYVVFDNYVSQVIAKEGEAKVLLPWGILFGESLSSVQKKLAATSGDEWRLTPYLGPALSSTHDYVGRNGHTFEVQFIFFRERLTEVRYNSYPV